MTNPTLITTPFAENGDKNIIPESVGAEPQNATMQAGFPPITQQKISEGGIPPERNDFNGILNLYGQHIVHLNKGLSYEFDQAFADTIGGYPFGAKLRLLNSAGVRSSTQNNTTNPNIDMSGWEYSDIIQFKTINDLIGFQSPKDGMIAKVKGYFPPENLALNNPFEGGGLFIYVSSKSSINDTGTIINGWVRQYSGDVDISWFGAKQGQDAGPFIEKALAISKSVVIRGSYTLESIIGIPDQNNYSSQVTKIRGENQATLAVNCASGAVFTSAAAKADPSNPANLYTGKIDISDINFIGTTVNNSVIFNGDRLYNLNIHHNNFVGNVTIIKAYLKREANRQYTQSCTIQSNHLANVYRVIVTDKAYNFDFIENMCETCIGGMYIGVDAPYDPSAISLNINGNLWEGGGLILKTNGGIIAGSVYGNYFENNTFHDAATEKCLISINRSGTGAGYSSGLLFSTNLFSGNTSITDFIDVRIQNQSTESNGNSKSATSKPAVFISNWSSSSLITNDFSALLIGNRCLNRGNMKNAYSPQEGRVSFVSGYLEKTLASILSTNILSILNIDTRTSFSNDYIGTNFKTTLDVTLYFKTSGGINTASCSFKIDLFVYTPYGAGSPSKSNVKAQMYGFMQSDTGDTITGSETMKSVITTPALTVTNNGDGTYVLKLGNFTNASSPNWGAITNVRVEYTSSSTLIGSATGTYSTANQLIIS